MPLVFRLICVALLAVVAPLMGRNLTMVLIIDGLRPDSITPEVMPNLAGLKAQGTFYPHAHSVFPTVTRVNSAVLATGTFPDRTGIVSNTMFLKEVVADRTFNTGDYHPLRRLAEVNGGRLLAPPTSSELVEKAGMRFVAVSSGSTGSAFLLNPEAARGAGVLINGGFEPGKRVAFPDTINETVLRRFGGVPSESESASLEWTERVLRDYVLPELHSDVVMDWITEPDGTQHKHGAGSPQALAALRKVDEQIGLMLAKLRELQLEATTSIIVTSDHGFSSEPNSVNITPALANAGEVVVANNGESALLFVKDHNPATIQTLVAELYKQVGGVIFTSAQQPSTAGLGACRPSQRLGWVKGTFSLDFIHQCHARTGADIVIALPWDSERNPFGVPGNHKIATLREAGATAEGRSGHGGFSPWSVGTTLILKGPAFKQHTVIEAPAGNQDIMPTLLKAVGIAVTGVDGRVLKEAFRGAPDASKGRTQVIEAGSGSRSKLRVSEVSGSIYFDAAWQEPHP